MSKTPIMVLQEEAIKNGFVPSYNEIASINGTHNNKFVIRVTCNGDTADGVSTSKKQAKQNAARQMLTLLTESGVFPKTILALLPAIESANPCTNDNREETTHARLSNSITDSPVSSLSSNSFPSSPVSEKQLTETFVNYVGKLNELCVARQLPYPSYEVTNVLGASHQPEFTMSCTIGALQEQASGSAKKKVKQDAAKKLLNRILGASSFDTVRETDTKNCPNSAKEDILAHLGVQFKSLDINDKPNHLSDAEREKILDIYKEKTVLHVSNRHNVPVFQYHTVLAEILRKTSFSFTGLQNPSMMETQNLKSVISLAFGEPLTELKFSGNSVDYMIGYRLDIKPTVLQIGIGKSREQAQRKALLKLYDLFVQFTK